NGHLNRNSGRGREALSKRVGYAQVHANRLDISDARQVHGQGIAGDGRRSGDRAGPGSESRTAAGEGVGESKDKGGIIGCATRPASEAGGGAGKRGGERKFDTKGGAAMVFRGGGSVGGECGGHVVLKDIGRLMG